MSSADCTRSKSIGYRPDPVALDAWLRSLRDSHYPVSSGRPEAVRMRRWARKHELVAYSLKDKRWYLLPEGSLRLMGIR